MADYKRVASTKRRKRNKIDILDWLRLTKNTFTKVWSLRGGPYFLSFGILALVVMLFAYSDITLSAGKVHHNVSIANYGIGGQSKEEAAVALKKRVQENIRNKITFKFKKNKLTISPANFDLSIDYEKSVEKAFDYGRDEGPILNASKRFLAWFRSANINPFYKISRSKIDIFLHQIGKVDHTPARNASIRIRGGKARLIKPKNGFGINRKKTELKLLAALLNPEDINEVNLEAERLYADVSEADARRALEEAKILISKPITLVYGKKKWSIGKQKIVTLFKTKVVDDSLKVLLAKEKTLDYIEFLTKSLNKKAKRAKFSVNGAYVSIIKSSDGLEVDNKETYENLLDAGQKTSGRSALVSAKKKKPSRTTEDAKKMGIKKLVSTFSTYYKPGKPRVKNIHLLTRILDGQLIAPGEKFSFNDRIGKRTEKRGFVKAPQIVKGELVDAIGGGICQVSTTIFNTVLLAGFPIGSRVPHSLFIDRYPEGRDAAVSYPGPDLTFSNDTDTWILIKGGYTSSGISISFYGTDYDRKVTFETELSAKIPYPRKEIKDNKLEKGKKVVEEKGVIGRRFRVIRRVVKDGKVIRETKINSVFKPKPRIVRVGTKSTEEEKKKKEEEEKKKEAAKKKKEEEQNQELPPEQPQEQQ